MTDHGSTDAADARHDAPYVPPDPCPEKFNSPRRPCKASQSTIHACMNPRVTHTVLCQCRCGFQWDITGHPVTQQTL